MFKFNDVKKIVLNLDRRQDRLEKFQSEMNYIGWDFERFSAIDTNSYVGCGLSHQKIAQDFLESKDDYILVMEDDLFIMPYTKELIPKIEQALSNVDWDFFHLGPSLHRPLQMYNDMLVDLCNLPPKDENKHRGIFGTTAFVLNKKSAEIIANWDTDKYYYNSHRQVAIDDYFDRVVYKNCVAFAPFNLFTTQRPDFSDINKTFDSNHYVLSYNWNAYVPTKIPTNMYDIGYCEKLRE
jgi:hypothetical protein